MSNVIDRVALYNQDFATVDTGPIDAIITDPPYPAEFLPQWVKLRQFAEKNLKPSGYLVAYSGQVNFPKVMQILSEGELEYFWTFALVHNGHTDWIMHRNVTCGWKPIVVFQKKPFRKLPKERSLPDIIQGSGTEKSLHDWQQGREELEPLIKAFSNPNDIVCDPFMGSGTTIAKGLLMGRRMIGMEIDEKHFYNAQLRTVGNRLQETEVKSSTVQRLLW